MSFEILSPWAGAPDLTPAVGLLDNLPSGGDSHGLGVEPSGNEKWRRRRRHQDLIRIVPD